MDAIDRRIVSELQGGFPVCDEPFKESAAVLGVPEQKLIERLRRLCDDGVLSRFGPLFDTEKLGGEITLAAMAVPEGRFEAVTEIVNAHPEVAHNYAREHTLNMWFVIAAETPGRVNRVIAEIEMETGIEVLDMPKVEEFFIGLRLTP